MILLKDGDPWIYASLLLLSSILYAKSSVSRGRGVSSPELYCTPSIVSRLLPCHGVTVLQYYCSVVASFVGVFGVQLYYVHEEGQCRRCITVRLREEELECSCQRGQRDRNSDGR